MKQVLASIITIGDELLIGQTIDTNSAFIAQELNKIGIWVKRRVAIGDDAVAMEETLDRESRDVQLVIMTGGLGPTADDITKPFLCRYFGGRLVVDKKVEAHVRDLFERVFRRPGPMLERNLKQAEVPDNCTVLFNERGTAPGMLFKREGVIFISLPGVPHEMKGIMISEVIPYITNAFERPAIVHRTAFTFGQGESLLAEALKEFEPNLPGAIRLAYLPNYGMVKLRLTAQAPTIEEAEALVDPYFITMQSLVKEYLVSDRDEGLEVVIGKLLREKGMTMGTAESCTGGYISHLVTTIPGSSEWFKGGVVSYSNAVKEDILGVNELTLLENGAVSEATVKEMVKGAITQLKVDVAVAVSGIMGPGGGTPEKPVGTVWIAAGNAERTETMQLHLRFDRARNITTTANQALNWLRKFIIANAR